MSEPEQPTVETPAPFNVNKEQFDKFFIELMEARRIDIADRGDATDKAFDVNKQVSAFYERLLLLDMGTLGLSVTALTSIAAKLPAGGAPRNAVVGLITLAWSFLLFSTIICVIYLSEILKLNKKSFDEWSKSSFQFHRQSNSTNISRIATTMSGTIQFGDKAVDLSDLLKDAATVIRKSVDDSKQILRDLQNPPPAARESIIKKHATSAIWFLLGALVLLGIAALVIVFNIKVP